MLTYFALVANVVDAIKRHSLRLPAYTYFGAPLRAVLGFRSWLWQLRLSVRGQTLSGLR